MENRELAGNGDDKGVKKRGKGAKGEKEDMAKEKKMADKNSGYVMEEKDRIILNEIQKKFPISHRPYLVLSRKLYLK